MPVRASTPEERLEAYLHRLGTVMGHAARLEPLRGDPTGLLLPGERNSVEPMAAKLEPTRVRRARHQSLLFPMGEGGLRQGAFASLGVGVDNAR